MGFFSGWLSAAVRRGKRANDASGISPTKSKARAAISRAVVETVEGRVYLTTFDAYMGAQQSGHFGSNYIVNLYTSGGQSSKWVVNWQDGTTVQTFTTAGTFGTAYAVTHTYATGVPATAAITATATLSGSSTTATASFALNNSYGTYQFQNSGRTTFTESGDTISADYTAVDTSTGYEYVLFSYNPGGASHNLMAVARFSSQGVIDDTWGQSSDGGNGIIYTQTSDAGNDVPLAIAVDSTDGDIMVVGECPSGWLIEEFSDGSNGDGTEGAKAFNPIEGTFGAGSAATAVYYTTTDGDFDVAGSDTTGDDFAVAVVSTSGTLVDTPVTVSPPGPDQGLTVTSVTQGDALSGGNQEKIFVGGYTNYCANGGGGVGGSSDFTVAELGNSLVVQTGFGSSGVVRYNVVGGYCTSCANDSIDQLYSLVLWDDGGTDVVTAVGNSVGCSVNTVLETFKLSDGSLETSYGSSGIAKSCSAFTPSAALLYTSGGSTNDEIIVTGSNGNGDFATEVFDTSGSPTGGSFGNSGDFDVDFGGTTTNSTDESYSIVELSDGSILLAGTSGGNIAMADCFLNVAPTLS